MPSKAVFFSALIALLAAAFAVRAGAEDAPAVECPGIEITVEGAAPALAGRVCDAAVRARDLLGECGLGQSRPVTIAIVEGFPPSHGPCLAAQDCREDRIEILPPDLLDDPDLVQGRFAEIPPEALFDSLIAHEMTHALLEQTYPRLTERTAHEYLAYAFQLDSMSETHRNLVLGDRAAMAPADLLMVNPVILMFSPGTFAANAWLFFDGYGGRCSSIDQIRDGRLGFEGWEP